MPHDLLQSALRVGHLIQNLNQEAERHAGLTLTQWSILRHLIARPSISARQLSEVLRLHPSTLTQALKRLTRKQLICVADDPRDSRRRVISLTREGKRTLERTEPAVRKLTDSLALVQGELAAVERGLEKL